MAVEHGKAEKPVAVERDGLEPGVPAGQPPEPSGPAWGRLTDQLGWYEAKSAHHRQWFLGLKVVQIVVAAAIPVIAAAGASATIAGALGAVIVVVEGVQQLFQFQQNWIAYRATAEALKHEKFLYLSDAGPYAGAERRDALLAERVERLVSKETSAWASAQRDAGAQTGGRGAADDGG